jgi:hypothetical protein
MVLMPGGVSVGSVATRSAREASAATPHQCYAAHRLTESPLSPLTPAPSPPRLQDVVWRVGSSFLGPFRPDFMAVTLSSPDLYGPFWVATTLIFVTAGVDGCVEGVRLGVLWRAREAGGAVACQGWCAWL